LKLGDVAVVNYTGTSEGKPLTEVAPTAKGLIEQNNFWVDITPNTFIAGFAAIVARLPNHRSEDGPDDGAVVYIDGGALIA